MGANNCRNVVVAFFSAAILLAQASTSDVFDKNGRRVGIVKENPYGGFDLYDKDFNRLGYGRASPYDPSVIELFDSKGNRLGTVRRPAGQDRTR
jgi:hypothetical protein